MAQTAYLPGAVVREATVTESPRHSLLVRVTHSINTIAFVALVVSGFGIILAHPRFYWGETGAVGTPSLFDLPLPFMLGGPSGWGRYMHFEAVWLCMLNGLLYLISGILSRHFRNNLLPAKGQFAWPSLSRQISNHLRFKRPPADEALSVPLLQPRAIPGTPESK